MVIPFNSCVARPQGIDGTIYPLREHLVIVAGECGNHNGNRHEQLKFLAGLLHDAGKAQSAWQNDIGQREHLVPHSSVGAALFVFFSGKLINSWHLKNRETREFTFIAFKLARDISDHHGELDDLTDEVIWGTVYGTFLDLSVFQSIDLKGLFELVGYYFPGLKTLAEDFFDWFEKITGAWECEFNSAKSSINRILNRDEDIYSKAAEMCLRKFTAAFISADRYHAAGLQKSVLSADEANNALDKLKAYCHMKARWALSNGHTSSEMLKLRQDAQDISFSNYINQRSLKNIFTLTLPTGVGKTVTALRTALASCAAGQCQRIIYVAPYLSILSQATNEITLFSGLEVLQHHHLSLIDKKGLVDGTEADDPGFLAMESWQAPVVATTFNQFFRALFPKRAQHSIRLHSCSKAFLIIDEPQIIDGKVWNLFLRLLETAAKEYQMQVLFVTATLPPLERGFTIPVGHLAPQLNVPGRYFVEYLDRPLHENEVARMAAEELERTGSVAVVMNTIRDAAQVFQLVKELTPKRTAVFNLSGCMTPIHKAKRIEEISCFLTCGYPTVVICTQILEAGVDLSFRSILRALPIVPSVAQVSGRANRHYTGTMARVLVFPFCRDGGLETRKYVYREKESVKATDEVFNLHSRWEEKETADIVEKYYQLAFDINPKTTFLEKLPAAALGKWSALSGIEPFGADYPRLSLFVPWGDHFLSWRMKQLLKRFSPFGVRGLFEKYLDKDFKLSLSFMDKKRFMALMQQFVVQIDPKYQDIASLYDKLPIGMINKPGLYSNETGLSHLLGNNDYSSCIIL